MASTSERMLRLLSLLQNNRDWSGTELADRLEVSGRTVRRDIDRLRALGYPVEGVRGAYGSYRLAAGASLPPLLLDDDEAVALVVGLRAGARSGIAGVAEASLAALSKVIQVFPARLRKRADALATMMTTPGFGDTQELVDPESLTTIALAARRDERIEFAYTARGGEESERCVEPIQLVLLGRRWYLVAYDTVRHDWRSFRVDRLSGVRSNGERFVAKPVPHGDALTFVQAAVKNVAPALTVEAVAKAPAADVRARIGRWAEVTELGARACRVTMTADSYSWPVMALASLDADITKVKPAAFRRHLATTGERFTRAAKS
jgi:predicted DNA-binding transcriptional regulator YafY